MPPPGEKTIAHLWLCFILLNPHHQILRKLYQWPLTRTEHIGNPVVFMYTKKVQMIEDAINGVCDALELWKYTTYRGVLSCSRFSLFWCAYSLYWNAQSWLRHEIVCRVNLAPHECRLCNIGECLTIWGQNQMPYDPQAYVSSQTTPRPSRTACEWNSHELAS